jgi:hypothetical protein
MAELGLAPASGPRHPGPPPFLAKLSAYALQKALVARWTSFAKTIPVVRSLLRTN